MLEVRRLDTGRCRLFLKLENQNPGGSIKDRVALAMIEAAERDGKLQTGLADCRSHRRQHRPRPRPGRGAEGLPAADRGAGQDEPGEDLPPEGDGRRSGADALRRHQGPPRVLPGHGSAARARAGRFLREPICQRGEPARARRKDRAGDLGADGAQGRRRGCRRGDRRDAQRPVALLREGLSRHRNGACRPGGVHRCRIRKDRKALDKRRQLAGGRHRRGLHSAGRGPFAREEGLQHPGRRKRSAFAATC